jgi:formate hydrogenlyase subunit 4
MIRLNFSKIRKYKNLKTRKYGVYGLILFTALIALSYIPLGELQSFLKAISDVILLRALSFIGLFFSGLIVLKGESSFSTLKGIRGFFEEARKLEEECGEPSRIFEKIMKGRWR